MKILITGGRGMLGRTLCRRLAHHEIFIFDLPENDITDIAKVRSVFEKEHPDFVIHAAAMTAVDECETQEKLAFKVNARGCATIAEMSYRISARLVAISTDYVFDGSLNRPYREEDATNPLSIYGRSKLQGESEVRRLCPNAAILRTGWLYGPGGPSFVHTLLRLGKEQGDPILVVNDQIGNPTSTEALAGLIIEFVHCHEPGVFHATCEGEATWHDLALAVFEHKGFIRPVVPCTSQEFLRPAKRPANSRLDKMALRQKGFSAMPHWRSALENFFKDHPCG